MSRRRTEYGGLWRRGRGELRQVPRVAMTAVMSRVARPSRSVSRLGGTLHVPCTGHGCAVGRSANSRRWSAAGRLDTGALHQAVSCGGVWRGRQRQCCRGSSCRWMRKDGYTPCWCACAGKFQMTGEPMCSSAAWRRGVVTTAPSRTAAAQSEHSVDERLGAGGRRFRSDVEY